MRTKVIQPWESLADLDTGQLVPAVPVDKLRVPTTVDRRDDDFCFTGGFALDRVRPPGNLLERFLEAETDAALSGFAKRFGSLAEPTDEVWEGGYRESIATWRRYQWEFGYLLTLAVAVREGSSIDVDPYEAFDEHGISLRRLFPLADISWWARRADSGETTRRPEWSERKSAQRRTMASTLLLSRAAALARSCGLKPALALTGRTARRFDIVFQDGASDFGMSLLGAITMQFFAAVTGSGFAMCSGCGRMFVPKRRKPAFGKRRYCQRCGRPAAVADAKAALRAREREKRATRERIGEK